MLRFIFLVSLVVLSLCSKAEAQSGRYNPYAPQEQDPSPVKSDGKLNWPRYFKSAELESRFQAYFQMGSCVGTRKAINDRLAENAVDVNALPEVTMEGRIVGRVGPAIVIQTDDRRQVAVVTHPAGVSEIKVEGAMPAKQLRSGMTIRAIAKVGKTGVQNEQLASIDVVSPTAIRPVEVKADRPQTIVATIDKVHGDHLHGRVPSGPVRNVTLPFGDDLKVHVDATSLELAGIDDRVIAKGHVLSPEAKQGSVLFASEVSIQKATK